MTEQSLSIQSYLKHQHLRNKSGPALKVPSGIQGDKDRNGSPEDEFSEELTSINFDDVDEAFVFPPIQNVMNRQSEEHKGLQIFKERNQTPLEAIQLRQSSELSMKSFTTDKEIPMKLNSFGGHKRVPSEMQHEFKINPTVRKERQDKMSQKENQQRRVSEIIPGNKKKHQRVISGVSAENSSIHIINIVNSQSRQPFAEKVVENQGIPSHKGDSHVKKVINMKNELKYIEVSTDDVQFDESENTMLDEFQSIKDDKFGKTQPVGNLGAQKFSQNAHRNDNQFSNTMVSPGTGRQPSSQKSTNSRDFKTAYRMLHEDLLRKHQQNLLSTNSNVGSTEEILLLGCSSLQQFSKQKGSLSSTLTTKRHSKKTSVANVEFLNPQGSTVYEKLYRDKSSYFARKRSIKNSKVEEEIKECTFTPNTNDRRRNSSRSFKKLYSDLVSAQKKSEDRINQLREEMSMPTNAKRFNQSLTKSQTQGALKSYNSSSITDKLYEEGLLKLKQINEQSKQLVDLRYTYKPQISKASQNLASARYSSNIEGKENDCNLENKSNSKRRSDQFIDSLHKEKLQKSKSRTRKDIPKSMPEITISRLVSDNKKSLECLEKRLERMLDEALYQLEFDMKEGIDQENLFIILKYLDYATVKDESFITNQVYKLFTPGHQLDYEQIILLLAGIEGVYSKNFCEGRQVLMPNGQWFNLSLRENFVKFHIFLQRLFINKTNRRFFDRQHDLDTLRNKFDEENGITHHPRLNRKSIQIDQERSCSKGKYTSRIEELFERQTEYVQARKAKEDEKILQELSDCTFKPQIYSEGSSSALKNGDGQSSIHQALYEIGKRVSIERNRVGNKSSVDLEYEKSQRECTFKPNLEKPDILKLPISQRAVIVNEIESKVKKEKSKNGELKRKIEKENSSSRRKQVNSQESKKRQSTVRKSFPLPSNQTSIQRHKCIEPFSPETTSSDATPSPFHFNLLQQQVNRLSDAMAQVRIKEEQIMLRNLLIQPIDSSFSPSNISPDSRQPVLFLEVNIGGDRPPGKLLLFDGDEPDEIVKCFAQVYQISENKKFKLLSIVREQLARILQQIGEAEEYEDDD